MPAVLAVFTAQSNLRFERTLGVAKGVQHAEIVGVNHVSTRVEIARVRETRVLAPLPIQIEWNCVGVALYDDERQGLRERAIPRFGGCEGPFGLLARGDIENITDLLVGTGNARAA